MAPHSMQHARAEAESWLLLLNAPSTFNGCKLDACSLYHCWLCAYRSCFRLSAQKLDLLTLESLWLEVGCTHADLLKTASPETGGVLCAAGDVVLADQRAAEAAPDEASGPLPDVHAAAAAAAAQEAAAGAEHTAAAPTDASRAAEASQSGD